MSSPSEPTPRAPGRFDLLRSPIEDGITLIEASAGTGKTYCLTGLVLRLLLEKRVEHVGRLLVVTFTNAATEELVGRIRQGLRQAFDALSAPSPPEGRDGDDGDLFAHLVRHHRQDGAEILRRALLDFDDLAVTTIHGFCKQALDESAFESGLPFELEFLESDDELLAETARDVWRLSTALPEARTPTMAEALAELGLGPETFLPDYREWSRYEGTALEPDPPDLATASNELEAAREALAILFDRARVRHLLSQVKWRSGKRSERELGDPARLEVVLSAIEDFLHPAEGEPRGGGLWALRLLEPTTLAEEAYKKDRDLIEELPGLVQLVAFHRALGQVEHAMRGRFLRQLAQAFPQAKARAANLAFDDLLVQLRDALADPRRSGRLGRAIRARFSVALIDEFQDTDLVQFEIFERLFGRGPLFLVGDPKQAIYRFRGADIHAYLKAKRNADRGYTLGHNWRSGRRLVEAVNAIFERGQYPFVFPEIPFLPVRSAEPVAERRLEGDGLGALSWWWLGEVSNSAQADNLIYEAVAAEVKRLLDGEARLVDSGDARRLRPGDIAVLVRSNQQATRMQEALSGTGIPSVIGRSGDIFHSEEMAELATLLRALLEPGRISRLRAACATLIWGDDAAELDASGHDDLRFQERVDDFESFRDAWNERGFVAMMELLVSSRRVRPRWLSLERGERRLTNLFHAVEVCHRAIHDHRLSPAGLVAWLDAERQLPRHERDAAELRLESDALAVDLATVHKSKGLEYEVVFCPFLWKARVVEGAPLLAHLPDSGRVVYDCGSERIEEHLAVAEAERLAEDLRLAYVALTRAKRRCYVVWGDIGRNSRSAASALAYLLHRPSLVGGAPSGSALGRAAETIEQIRTRSGHWLEDLRQLVDAHPELMSLRRFDDAADDRQQAPPEPTEALSLDEAESTASGASEDGPSEDGAGEDGAGEDAGYPRLESLESSAGARARLRTWRISSYSSLTRDSHGSEAETVLEELPDRGDPTSPPREDERPTPPGVPPLAAEDPSAVRASPAVPATVVPVAAGPVTTGSVADPAPAGIFAFARGPRAGDCLHQIFEEIDFPDADGAWAHQVIEDKLRLFDLLEPENHRRGTLVPELDPLAVARTMVRNVVSARLPGESFALAAIPRAKRLVEWQFYTPLRPLAGSDLARLIREHAAAEWRDAYAARLERLRAHDVRGFLTGFVDLIFEHQGRWFVLDWKSNHLGDHARDYDGPAMTHAMVEHHYLLQYHLYVAALHRFLATRLAGFDYETDFGGVFYVFLRGVEESPAEPPVEPFSRAFGQPKKSGRSRHHQGQLELFASREVPVDRRETEARPAGDSKAETEASAAVNGIFHDRPPQQLIEALADRLFGPVNGFGKRGAEIR